MNPRILLLAIACIAMLNSCTKETFTPTSTINTQIPNESLPDSVIELFYEDEETQQNSNSRRIYVAPPPSVELNCKREIPSVIIPKVFNKTLEFVYATNRSYNSSVNNNIRSLGWKVNGKEQPTFETTLKLPYEVNDVFDVELVVTFTDESTNQFDFAFEATANLETLSDGTVKHNTGASSFSGSTITISQSCTDESNRTIGIVIIDTDF